MAAPTDVKQFRDSGVATEVTALTKTADVKLVLATPVDQKDELIDPSELVSGLDYTEDTTSGTTGAIDNPRAAGTRMFGVSQYGDALREGDHFTVAGTAITIIDPSILSGTEITWFFRSANPITNPAPIRQAANIGSGDPTLIDLDAVMVAFITAPAAETNYTASGTANFVHIVNEENFSIQFQGIVINANESLWFANPGSGWRIY